MSKRDIEDKLTLELPQLITYLRGLVDSLESRRVFIEKDGDVLSLSPAETVELEIEARQKRGKERLSIELRWQRTPVSESDKPGLKISSGGPLVTPPHG